MGDIFNVFQIRSNPIGLGAKILCNVPASEKTSQKPVHTTSKSQHIRKNMFFKGSKRGI